METFSFFLHVSMAHIKNIRVVIIILILSVTSLTALLHSNTIRQIIPSKINKILGYIFLIKYRD